MKHKTSVNIWCIIMETIYICTYMIFYMFSIYIFLAFIFECGSRAFKPPGLEGPSVKLPVATSCTIFCEKFFVQSKTRAPITKDYKPNHFTTKPIPFRMIHNLFKLFLFKHFLFRSSYIQIVQTIMSTRTLVFFFLGFLDPSIGGEHQQVTWWAICQ